MTDRSAPPLRSFRGLAPFVAIPGAVALVCVLILSLASPKPSLSYWTRFHSDSARVFAPEGVYAEGWDTVQYEPFSGNRIGLQEVLLGLVAYGGTIVIGERILRSLVKRYRWPLALRLGGAFLIGYVPVFAFVRLVTLRVDTDVAPWLCLSAIGASAVVSLAFDVRTRAVRGERLSKRDLPLPIAVVLSAFAIVVWTVQSGRNYLVSDSVLLFLGVAAGKSGPLDWLPPFGRQMDEFLFNYPMAYAARGSTTFALWFWLTNAIAKVSMVWLIAGVVWTLT